MGARSLSIDAVETSAPNSFVLDAVVHLSLKSRSDRVLWSPPLSLPLTEAPLTPERAATFELAVSAGASHIRATGSMIPECSNGPPEQRYARTRKSPKSVGNSVSDTNEVSMGVSTLGFVGADGGGGGGVAARVSCCGSCLDVDFLLRRAVAGTEAAAGTEEEGGASLVEGALS